jgi:hypothetical protein
MVLYIPGTFSLYISLYHVYVWRYFLHQTFSCVSKRCFSCLCYSLLRKCRLLHVIRSILPLLWLRHMGIWHSLFLESDTPVITVEF